MAIGGFSQLPRYVPRKPKKPLPAPVAAETVAFDEDGRRLVSAPLQTAPLSTPTVAPPGGFTRAPGAPPKKIEWRNGGFGQKPPPGKTPIGPQWDPVTKTMTQPDKTPVPTATTFERNSDGVYKSRPLQAGEKPALTPDMIPY